MSTYIVMRPSKYCKTLVFPSLLYLFKLEIIPLSPVEVGSKDQQHRERMMRFDWSSVPIQSYILCFVF